MVVMGQSGTKHDKRVIVEMTSLEFGELTGVNRTNQHHEWEFPAVGSTFAIRKAWEAVHSIKSAEERVVRFARELRGIADDAEALCRKLPELTGLKEEGS